MAVRRCGSGQGDEPLVVYLLIFAGSCFLSKPDCLAEHGMVGVQLLSLNHNQLSLATDAAVPTLSVGLLL